MRRERRCAAARTYHFLLVAALLAAGASAWGLSDLFGAPAVDGKAVASSAGAPAVDAPAIEGDAASADAAASNAAAVDAAASSAAANDASLSTVPAGGVAEVDAATETPGEVTEASAEQAVAADDAFALPAVDAVTEAAAPSFEAVAEAAAPSFAAVEEAASEVAPPESAAFALASTELPVEVAADWTDAIARVGLDLEDAFVVDSDGNLVRDGEVGAVPFTFAAMEPPAVAHDQAQDLNPLAGYSLRNPAWIESYDPVVNARAAVLHGPARFSVLRDGLVRLEWSPHSPPVHHDTGSVFAVNRYAPNEAVPAFRAEIEGSVLTLTTDKLRLVYDSTIDEGRGFTAANLVATVLSLGTEWRPGQAATGSLHGTIRTLDRMGRRVPLACEQPSWMNDTHCEEGVASLNGWSVIDDSFGVRWEAGSYGRYYVFTTVAPWPWITGPAEPPPPPAPESCAADRSMANRFECIWGNIVDEQACRAKGCCFDAEAAAAANGQAPALHFVPWCFYPSRAKGGAAGYTDLYLFGSGRDYKASLADFVFVGGKVPLSPRYQLGPHFSRWFPYADFEEREIAANYRQLGLPLDVMVVDTDWHSPYERGFPDPQPDGVHLEPWTGYTVSPDVLPAPRRLLEHWAARGVRSALNLHLPPLVPRAGGVQYFEPSYAAMAAVTGQDPARGDPILGDYGNVTWVAAFLDLVIAPIMRHSPLSLWWTDWQQGEAGVGSGPGLPVTLWISYIFSSAPQLWPPLARILCGHGEAEGEGEESDAAKASAESCRHGGGDFYAPRPTLMNRFGGLGSHRFPVGFSGDAETSWDMLRLQTTLTPTAANVAQQWSHDIGGFAGLPDAELMVRWTQFGVFSPILRPHCAGRGGSSRDVWAHPWSPALAILRSYYRLRARLVPYLATAQRVAYDTGVLPVHPLYYEHPFSSLVYYDIAQEQYYFGDAIWVAPISEPATDAGGLTRKTIFFPPGSWIEWGSWQSHSAPDGEGAFYSRLFALEEVPIFSPPGAIIPLRTLPDQDAAAALAAGHADVLGTAAEVPGAITLMIFPPGPGRLGSTVLGEAATVRFSTKARLYDDDGLTLAYAENAASRFLWTEISCDWIRSTSERQPEADAPGAAAARELGLELGLRDRVTCTVHPPEGRHFAAFPLVRTYTLRFISTFPPETVEVAENFDEFMQPAAWHNAEGPDQNGDGGRFPVGVNAWSYDGASATTWVHVGLPANPSNPLRVTLAFAAGAMADDAVLTSALARKVSRAQAAKREMGRISWSAFPVDVPRILGVANLGARVEELLDSHNIAGGATSLSTALLRREFVGLHGELDAGVREVEQLERRLEPLIRGGEGGEGGTVAAGVVAAMRALVVNGVS